jgi:prevent-host-death family protein
VRSPFHDHLPHFPTKGAVKFANHKIATAVGSVGATILLGQLMLGPDIVSPAVGFSGALPVAAAGIYFAIVRRRETGRSEGRPEVARSDVDGSWFRLPPSFDPGSLKRRMRVSHRCYSRRMAVVASRELRNNTRSLLDRVEAGEEVTITVDGRPVAVLQPVGRRPRWLGRDEFVRLVASHQADASLRADLVELAPDSTEDLPPL